MAKKPYIVPLVPPPGGPPTVPCQIRRLPNGAIEIVIRDLVALSAALGRLEQEKALDRIYGGS